MSFLDRLRESKARAKVKFKDIYQGHGSSRPLPPILGASTTSYNTLAPVATSSVPMHPDSAIPANNLINHPATSASMSTIATSHTAGDSGSDAQPVHSFPPQAPQPSQVPKAASNTEGRKWNSLTKLVDTLQKASGTFGPLKLVVDELIKCVEIYERVSNSRNEYAELQKELEGILEELRQHISSTSPPTMTTSIESLCKSIQEELAYVQGKKTEGMTRRIIKVEENTDQVLLCYKRIRGYLRQLLLNANLDMWKIVDNLATDNRLKDLSPSHSARYDSSKAAELKRGPCTDGTRVEVLAQMHEWTHNIGTGCICWMNGMAGTGKTTIAYTLCAQLHEEKKLAASFFCSRLLPECRDVNLIIPSIAHQLAHFSRPFRWALSRAMEEEPNAHTSLPRSQFETLIAKPLLEVQSTLPSNMAIVIDALDECDNKDSTRQILDVLLSNVSGLPVKILVSSRPESEIRDQMMSPAKQIDSRIVLHELDKGQVQLDIATYLKAALAPMNPRPSEMEIAELVRRAGVLFIYAATAVRYIGYDNFRRNARARLQTVLSASSSGKTNKNKEIDELYTTILRAALDDPGLDETEREGMKLVLHTVICAQEPLTTRAISGLLRMGDSNRIDAALRPLWSVLHIVGTSDLVTTLHASFPDYMFDSIRSKEYYCDPTIHNSMIALLCFDLIKHTQPQFNICGLESSYVTDENVPNLEQRIDGAISTELFYACRHWVTHLCATSGSPELCDGLKDFLSVRLLLWMEVMNLKKCMHTGPGKIRSAEEWIMRQSSSSKLTELVRDVLRFTTTFASNPISQSTPHIYVSMLLFWPSSSPISQRYLEHIKGMTEVSRTAVGQQMPALLARWLPGKEVASATFSPDGARIALAVDSQAHVLDAFSGRMALDPLQGHNNRVLSVSFSPDGTHIISGSEDKTICLWDAQRGQIMLPPLQGHTGPVRSVVFSPDGSRVASGSDDHTICLWDSQNGQMLLGPLEGHADWVLSIAFSPDGTRIVSGSCNNLIRLWDTRNGYSLLNPLQGHTDLVQSVGFSPDGTRVISGSVDATIRLWDVETGEMVLGPITGHTRSITSVAFSPDGSQIISGSFDCTVCIWNAQSGEMVSDPLTGHFNAITSVAFSPDGINILSASGVHPFNLAAPYPSEYAVHLWDARAALTTCSPLQGHTKQIHSVKYSPDGTLIASGSNDCKICLWDAQTGQMLFDPLIGHSGSIFSVAFSPDGTSLVSGSADCSIFVWGVSSGEMVLGPLNRHADEVMSVDFSPDGRRIVSGSKDNTICLWDTQSGELVLPPLKGHKSAVVSVTFSPNGTCIVSGSYDGIIHLWDASSGQVLQCLPKYLLGVQHVFSVDFSPDGTCIASASYSHYSHSCGLSLWDIDSGQELPSSPKIRFELINSVQFSPDGSRMISGSGNGSVCLWDALTGQLLLNPLHGHTDQVTSIMFSPNGTRAASCSSDRAIRVWDIWVGGAVNGPEWELNEDGWVVDTHLRLLIWVPPSLRRLLMRPRNTLLISSDGYVRLNFEGALLGEAKALEVADLKEILSKSGTTIRSKANKADLIAKILDTPAAFDVAKGGSGGGAEAASAPAAPAATAELARHTPAAPRTQT